jgi:hypothetical protein
MRTNIRNYEEWKWRSLRKRRFFFFVFTNAILTLAWAVVHYDEPKGYSTADSGKNYPSKNLSATARFQLTLMYGLPSFFFYLHGVGCLLISCTQRGQRIIQETQGKKFCIWSAMSMVLVALFLLIPLIYEAPTLSSAQRMVRAMHSSADSKRFHFICSYDTVILFLENLQS